MLSQIIFSVEKRMENRMGSWTRGKMVNFGLSEDTNSQCIRCIRWGIPQNLIWYFVFFYSGYELSKIFRISIKHMGRRGWEVLLCREPKHNGCTMTVCLAIVLLAHENNGPKLVLLKLFYLKKIKNKEIDRLRVIFCGLSFPSYYMLWRSFISCHAKVANNTYMCKYVMLWLKWEHDLKCIRDTCICIHEHGVFMSRDGDVRIWILSCMVTWKHN